MKRIIVDKRIHGDISGGQYIDETGQKITQIKYLGKINIFVGANNSGKSRFLRGLIKSNEFLVAEKDYSKWSKEIISEINYIKNNYVENKLSEIFFDNVPDIKSLGVTDKKQIELFKKITLRRHALSNTLETLLREMETLTADNIEDFYNQKTSLALCKCFLFICKNISESHQFNNHLSPIFRGQATKRRLLPLLESLITKMGEMDYFGLKAISPPKIIYIPILRTIRALISSGGKQAADIFLDTIKNEYFDTHKSDKTEIFTGLGLYQNIFVAQHSKKTQRNKIEQFENFLSAYFFGSKKVEIVSQGTSDSKKDTILITLGEHEDDEKEVHHLGDGIQSLILILWPIFNAENDTWVYIEEPEMHLHPGMQRVFIEQLCSNQYILNKNLTIFFTTHSNHLVDLALIMEKNLSVINFKEKNGKKLITPVLTGNSDILKGLGVTNTSVFMAKCTIWVEGPSDVKIIRAYLKKHIKQLHAEGKNPKKIIEDIDYAFFIYAGSNLAHYLFSNEIDLNEKDSDSYINGSMLSNNIFLLADRDFAKDDTHAKRAQEQHPGFTYKVLESREIENTVPESLLKAVLSKIYPKALSEEILRGFQFRKNEYQDKYLGEYLKNSINSPGFPSTLLSESGTLSSHAKNQFSTALSEILENDDTKLDDECTKLASQIYEFILKNN